jgi:hypothetical protein
MREQYAHWLEVLMAVSGFVLLIVCANVADLMLVRGMERRRQISLSMALGAQTSRVVRQPFAESILLSLFGGAVGLLIAFAGTPSRNLIIHCLRLGRRVLSERNTSGRSVSVKCPKQPPSSRKTRRQDLLLPSAGFGKAPKSFVVARGLAM